MGCPISIYHRIIEPVEMITNTTYGVFNWLNHLKTYFGTSLFPPRISAYVEILANSYTPPGCKFPSMKKSFITYHSVCITFYLLTVFLFSGCTKKTVLPPQSKICMDTVCSVNAYDDGTEALYSSIFTLLDSIEKKFSLTIPDSEICRVNKNAGIGSVEVSKEFLYVVDTANKISELTDGSLDISANPLIELWGINTDHAKVPAEDEIKSAMKKIDWKKIRTDDSSVFLEEKGMSMNLGAIVKGYAADEIIKILKTNKVKKAVVDLGGNIYMFGKKADGSLWNVGVKNPESPNAAPMLKISTAETSVVTSGNYERYFEMDGIRYHHIFDTRTGKPSQNGTASATIVCTKSILADCLSTAFFVMGEEKAARALPKIEEEFNVKIAAIFIDDKSNFSTIGKIEIQEL